MKKINIFSTVFILFVVIAGIFLWQIKTNYNPQTAVQTKLLIEQKILLPKISNNFIRYYFPQKTTALTLLQQTAKVKSNGEGTSAFVTEIDGRQALSQNKEYWAFYVNGKLANVGAGSYVLQNNDKITWQIDHY